MIAVAVAAAAAAAAAASAAASAAAAGCPQLPPPGISAVWVTLAAAVVAAIANPLNCLQTHVGLTVNTHTK